jgi:hypothetical protein
LVAKYAAEGVPKHDAEKRAKAGSPLQSEAPQ